MKNRIYHVKTGEYGYDVYTDFIVFATSEKEAEDMILNARYDYGRKSLKYDLDEPLESTTKIGETNMEKQVYLEVFYPG